MALIFRNKRSTRFDSLPRATQAFTGRIQFLDILPLSQGEIDASHEDFLEVALTEPERLARQLQATTTRTEYIERVCRGGLPATMHLDERQSRRWFDSGARTTRRQASHDRLPRPRSVLREVEADEVTVVAADERVTDWMGPRASRSVTPADSLIAEGSAFDHANWREWRPTPTWSPEDVAPITVVVSGGRRQRPGIGRARPVRSSTPPPNDQNGPHRCRAGRVVGCAGAQAE